MDDKTEFVEIERVCIGPLGASRLLQAFLTIPGETSFTLEAFLGSIPDAPERKVIIVRIGETSSAFLPRQLRSFVELLVAYPDVLPQADNVHRFGRLLGNVADDMTPGAHGVH